MSDRLLGTGRMNRVVAAAVLMVAGALAGCGANGQDPLPVVSVLGSALEPGETGGDFRLRVDFQTNAPVQLGVLTDEGERLDARADVGPSEQRVRLSIPSAELVRQKPETKLFLVATDAAGREALKLPLVFSAATLVVVDEPVIRQESHLLRAVSINVRNIGSTPAWLATMTTSAGGEQHSAPVGAWVGANESKQIDVPIAFPLRGAEQRVLFVLHGVVGDVLRFERDFRMSPPILHFTESPAVEFHGAQLDRVEFEVRNTGGVPATVNAFRVLLQGQEIAALNGPHDVGPGSQARFGVALPALYPSAGGALLEIIAAGANVDDIATHLLLKTTTTVERVELAWQTSGLHAVTAGVTVSGNAPILIKRSIWELGGASHEVTHDGDLYASPASAQGVTRDFTFVLPDGALRPQNISAKNLTMTFLDIHGRFITNHTVRLNEPSLVLQAVRPFASGCNAPDRDPSPCEVGSLQIVFHCSESSARVWLIAEVTLLDRTEYGPVDFPCDIAQNRSFRTFAFTGLPRGVHELTTRFLTLDGEEIMRRSQPVDLTR